MSDYRIPLLYHSSSHSCLEACTFEFGGLCTMTLDWWRDHVNYWSTKMGSSSLTKYQMIGACWKWAIPFFLMCVGILLSLFDQKGDGKVSIRMIVHPLESNTRLRGLIVHPLESDMRFRPLRQNIGSRDMYASYQCSLCRNMIWNWTISWFREHFIRQLPVLFVQKSC